MATQSRGVYFDRIIKTFDLPKGKLFLPVLSGIRVCRVWIVEHQILVHHLSICPVVILGWMFWLLSFQLSLLSAHFFTPPAFLASFLDSASTFMCFRSAFLGIFPLICRPRGTNSPQAFGCSTVLVKHPFYVLVQHVHFIINYLHT